jgi:hypothetical protein
MGCFMALYDTLLVAELVADLGLLVFYCALVEGNCRQPLVFAGLQQD